jgi:hypothetical protein
MNELEAVAIATEFLGKQRIRHLGVERAFFVPVASFDYQPPGLKDRWVVHFRTPPSGEGQLDRLLSDDPTKVIVSVDAETRTPSLLGSL